MTNETIKAINELCEHGLGYKRIANTLGVSVSTVKSYLIRHKKNENAHNCPTCGKQITQTPNRKEKRFCSDKCRMNWWKSHQNEINHKNEYEVICPVCGQAFTSFRSNAKYCSRKCFADIRRKEKLL